MYTRSMTASRSPPFITCIVMQVSLNPTLPMNRLNGFSDEESSKLSMFVFTKVYSKTAAVNIIVTNSTVVNAAESALLFFTNCDITKP